MGRVHQKRWVVKLGSGILTNAEGKLDLPQIKQLVGQVVALEEMGYEVTLVSSGAVAAGMGALSLAKRPTVMRELQACAAIGQPKLMALYDELFDAHKFHVAQLLLTYLDLDSRSLYANTQNTLNYLLGLKRFVPIINENDVVSYEEIKFGDNDQLSAHVAVMIAAERLIILSNIRGLAMNPDGSGELIRRVKKVDASIEALAGTTQSERSVGGMVSKLKAARVSAAAGVTMQIANGREPNVLVRIGQGEEIGTVFDA